LPNSKIDTKVSKTHNTQRIFTRQKSKYQIFKEIVKIRKNKARKIRLKPIVLTIAIKAMVGTKLNALPIPQRRETTVNKFKIYLDRF